MKKLYRIVSLLIVLIFLSTYNSIEFNLIEEKKNNFFKIKKIKIVNNSLIKKTKIKINLKKIYNKNIFTIKKKDIENPLKEIDFFKKIEVKKKYPNTIIVKVFETKPVAFLYINKDKYLLDELSNLILIKDKTDFSKLPSVFGKGAENNFIQFFDQLQKNKFPIKYVKNFYFYQIGRWDLQLLNDKTIKFPYNNIETAIRKSIELLNRKDFENYNIIDLRIEGKIIVE